MRTNLKNKSDCMQKSLKPIKQLIMTTFIFRIFVKDFSSILGYSELTMPKGRKNEKIDQRKPCVEGQIHMSV